MIQGVALEAQGDQLEYRPTLRRKRQVGFFVGFK